MEKITVLGKSKWGVLVKKDPDLWLNFEKGSGLSPASLDLNKEYTVDIVQNGKYRNIKAVEGLSSTPAEPKKTFTKKPFVPFAKKADTGMTKEDWAAKDRSQMIGGRSHDAVELVKACVNSGKEMTEILTLYREALDGLIVIADEVK